VEPDGHKVDTIRRGILSWYGEHHREFPWREAKTPYDVLIAELLLHQTFARKVVPVYLQLVASYPSPAHLSGANPEDILDIIRPLGFLYRAGRLVDLGKVLVRDYSGVVPWDERQLLSLPGVGPYTANAVLCFAFGKPVAIVDTNVLRVYRRIFSTAEHTTGLGPDKASVEVARAVLPQGHARDFNYAILDFAALVCTHYSPKCTACPLLKICNYGQGQLSTILTPKTIKKNHQNY
jgi:A/G-specific adenine glycosylase